MNSHVMLLLLVQSPTVPPPGFGLEERPGTTGQTNASSGTWKGAQDVRMSDLTQMTFQKGSSEMQKDESLHQGGWDQAPHTLAPRRELLVAIRI